MFFCAICTFLLGHAFGTSPSSSSVLWTLETELFTESQPHGGYTFESLSTHFFLVGKTPPVPNVIASDFHSYSPSYSSGSSSSTFALFVPPSPTLKPAFLLFNGSSTSPGGVPLQINRVNGSSALLPQSCNTTWRYVPPAPPSSTWNCTPSGDACPSKICPSVQNQHPPFSFTGNVTSTPTVTHFSLLSWPVGPVVVTFGAVGGSIKGDVSVLWFDGATEAKK
eukprot:TRINITY_DN36891_c0_g1_i1.p1 TRINITY_DN36891_c0_g1~~TRINITY_DN36891_c0_g1_i1.p1  ORF type:complete len:223 (+),score=5.76 TRINITY_DN36891_c0_g1_i1:118-786(+)